MHYDLMACQEVNKQLMNDGPGPWEYRVSWRRVLPSPRVIL